MYGAIQCWLVNKTRCEQVSGVNGKTEWPPGKADESAQRHAGSAMGSLLPARVRLTNLSIVVYTHITRISPDIAGIYRQYYQLHTIYNTDPCNLDSLPNFHNGFIAPKLDTHLHVLLLCIYSHFIHCIL